MATFNPGPAATTGNDTISALGAAETIDGLAGVDTLLLTANYNTAKNVTNVEVVQIDSSVTTGLNINWAAGLSGITLSGNSGNDTLGGSNFADMINGNDGNDAIAAAQGNDYADGGAGNDSLGGGRGFDTLLGGAGADSLAGSQNDDVVRGGDGDDLLDETRDTGVVNTTTSELSPAGNNLLAGGAGDDIIWGGFGRDTIQGGVGNDLLLGNGGDDSIYTGAGTDTVFGGLGGDTVYISANNTATTLVINTSARGVDGVDVVYGFRKGVDKIQLIDKTLGLDPFNNSGTPENLKLTGTDLSGLALSGDALTAALNAALADQSLDGGDAIVNFGNGTTVVFKGVSTGLTGSSFLGYTGTSLAVPDVTVAEGNTGTTAMTFNLKLAQPAGADYTLNYQTLTTGTAIAGTDFVASSGTISFSKGDQEKTLTVLVTGDTAVETTETVKVKFFGPGLDDVTATGYITNDDTAASYTITPPTGVSTVQEGNELKLTVNMNPTATTDTVLTYFIQGDTKSGAFGAAAAADFSSVNGTLTIPAGSSSANLSITPLSDGVVEGLEGFTVSLFDASLNKVGVSNTVAITDGAASGSSFTLTTGVDNITGGTGNDTISGALAGAGAGTAGFGSGTTLNPGDIITGGAGTDTLSISISGAFQTTADTAVSGFQLSGIERVLVSNFDTSTQAPSTQTVSLSSLTGITEVGLGSSTADGDTQFNGLDYLVGGYMASGNADLTIVYSSAVSLTGSADAQTLTLGGGVTGGTFTAGSGNFETLNLVSQTSSNNLATLASTGAKTVNVTGNKDLTISTELNSSVTTINAKDFTGALNVGGTGGGAIAITGGSGNDVFRLGSTLDSADTIDGGAGTDILAVTATFGSTTLSKVTNIETLAVGGTQGTSTVYDVSKISGISNILVQTSFDGTQSVGTVAISGVADKATITVKSDLANTGNTVATTLTNTELNLILDNSTSDTNGNFTQTTGLDVATIGFTNVKTLNLTSTGGGLASSGQTSELTFGTASSLTTLKVAGDTSLKLLSIPTTVTSIDAGSFSAAFGASLTNTTAVTLSGGTGADSITGGSGNDKITTGAGADSVYGGSGGNDNIDTGEGNDYIQIGAAKSTGTATVEAGAGNDIVYMGSSQGSYAVSLGAGDDYYYVNSTTSATAFLDSADTINGGDGTDRLSIIASAGATTTAVAWTSTNANVVQNVTNFEGITLDIGGVGHATAGTLSFAFDDILASSFNGSIDLTVIDSLTATSGSAASVTAVVSIDASGVLLKNSNVKVATTAAVVHQYDIGNATENVTLGSKDDTFLLSNVSYLATADTLAGGAGSDILAFDYATGSAVSVSLDTTNLTNVTGIETVDLNFDGVASASTVSFVISDAFAVANRTSDTSTFTVGRTDGGTMGGTVDDTGKTTITGSAVTSTKLVLTGATGADSITGGGGNDTLTGNAGNDTLIGGAGNDSLNGGADGDSLVGGEGADTLVGSSGSDIITLTETTAARDTVIIGGTQGATTQFGDVISGFTPGSSGDYLFLGYTDGGSGFTTGDSFAVTSGEVVTLSATSGTWAASAELVIVKGAIAGSADVTTVASFLDGYAGMDSTGGTGDSVGFVVVSISDGNARIYALQGSDDGNVTAGEVSVVTTLVGVSTDSLDASNFGYGAA